MLRKWLRAIKYLVAVATAIFVGRHMVLQHPAQDGSVLALSIGSRYGLSYPGGPTVSIVRLAG
jgi:hypothetical protein